MAKKNKLSKLTDNEIWQMGGDATVTSMSDAQAKELLLEMARRGFPRPRPEQNLLGQLFEAYTTPPAGGQMAKKKKLSRMTDNEIWQMGADETVQKMSVAQTKELLLEMARRGFPRPRPEQNLLGQLFEAYTTPPE